MRGVTAGGAGARRSAGRVLRLRGMTPARRRPFGGGRRAPARRRREFQRLTQGGRAMAGLDRAAGAGGGRAAARAHPWTGAAPFAACGRRGRSGGRRPVRVVPAVAAAAALTCHGSQAARAGAPTLLPGAVEILATGTFVTARPPRGATDRAGRAARKDEMELRAEYGLADGVTVLFSPRASLWAERGFREGAAAPAGWRLDAGASALAGARVRLWRGERDVLSFEAAVRAGAVAADVAAPDMRRALEAEARLLWLRGSGGAHPWFVELQAGYRWRHARGRRGGPVEHVGEILLDATFGVRLSGRLLLLAQNFSTFAASGPDQSLHRLQLSAAWTFAPGWTVQAGVQGAWAGGGRAWRDRGVIIGVWRRFDSLP